MLNTQLSLGCLFSSNCVQTILKISNIWPNFYNLFHLFPPPPLRNYHHHFHDLLHFIYTFKTELPTGWLTAVMRTGWSLEDLSCATLNIGDSKNAVRKLLLIIYFEIELSNYLTALIDVIFAFWQEIWNCMFNLILYLILRFYIITFEKKEMFWK